MLNCKKLAAVMRSSASAGLIWYDNGESVSVLDEAGSFCAVAQMQALLDGKNSIPALMAELIGRVPRGECIRIWKANDSYTEQTMVPDVAEDHIASWQSFGDVCTAARIALSVGDRALFQTEGGEIVTVQERRCVVAGGLPPVVDLTNYKIQWSGEDWVYITKNDRPAGTASASNDLWRSLEKITWVKDSGSELCGRDMDV